MKLSIDTIIYLENEEKYVLINETVLDDTKYFLAMGVDAQNEIIPTKLLILEEINDAEDTYVETVTDPELIFALTTILKP